MFSPSPQLIQNLESGWHWKAGLPFTRTLNRPQNITDRNSLKFKTGKCKALHLAQPQVSVEAGDQLARF